MVKRVKKPIQFMVSDFETLTKTAMERDGHNDTRVILANTIEFETLNHHTTININDWWNHLYSYGRNQIVYFHNLDFDGAFIIPFLLTKYKHKNKIDKQKDVNKFTTFQSGKKIYYIRVQLLNKQNRRFYIEFRCSYKILNEKVEVLGQAYGINKHEADEDESFYDQPVRSRLEDFPPRFVEYCRNDTLIVVKALKDLIACVNTLKFIAKYNEIQKRRNHAPFNVLRKLTASGLAISLMKEAINYFNFTFRAHNSFLTVSADVHEFFKDYYAGAITQIHNGHISSPKPVKEAIMIDVVSAYPAVMTEPLPYGEVLTQPPKKGTYCTFVNCFVLNANIKPEYKDIAFLKNWPKQWHNQKATMYYDPENLDKKSRYILTGKNFMVFYLLEEWETLQKFYDIEFDEASYTLVYMKSKPFLRYFINEVFTFKELFSKQKKKGLKQAIKIILNSSYGAMAKRVQYDNYLYVPKNDLPVLSTVENDEHFTYDNRLHRLNNKATRNNFLGEDYELWNVWDLEYENKYPMNKACACVITARQRVNIMETVLRYGAEHFLYTDTDSLVLGNLTPEQKQKIIDSCGTKLGDWEVEFPKWNEAKNKNDEIAYFAGFGSKKYSLLDEDMQPLKQRFAGISEKISQYKQKALYTQFDGDDIEVKDACLRPKQYPSGIVFEKVDKVIMKGTI